MTNENNEFIGVKHFDNLVYAISGRVSELLGDGTDSNEAFSIETYKAAFETLAKHVRGYAEHHDNGSMLWSLVMESNEDLSEDNSDAFILIQEALSKGGN